jgi:hypothetical protein
MTATSSPRRANPHDGRTRLIVAAAALVVVATACGGRAGTSTTAGTADTPPPTTTAAPTTTTAAPTTTLAPTTTTTTAATDAPLLAVVQGFSGEWAGTWTNTTFGSTGPADATLEVLDDGSIVATIDLGGSVFGQADPDEERWIVNLADLAQPVIVQSATFGEITLIVSIEGARLTAVDVPADGIANFQLDARFDVGPRIIGTYIVGFDDGSIAEGTADLQRIAP